MTSTPPFLPPARSTRSQRTYRDGSPMATAKPEPTTTTTTVTTVTSLATPAFAAPTSTIVATINNASLTPPPFSGTPQENSKEWIKYFIRYVTFKQLSEPANQLFLHSL